MALEEVGRPQVATTFAAVTHRNTTTEDGRWRQPLMRASYGKHQTWRGDREAEGASLGNHVYGQLYRGFEPNWNLQRSGRFQ